MARKIRLVLFILFALVAGPAAPTRAASPTSHVAKKPEPEAYKPMKPQSYEGGRIPRLKSGIPPLPVHDPTYKDKYRWVSPHAVGPSEDKVEEELDADGEE